MPGARTGRSMPSACPPGSSSMNPREKVGGGEESACPMGGELDFDNLLFSQDRDDDEDPQRSLCVADHDETCKTLLTTDLPVEGRTLTERGHSFVGPSPSLTTASVEDLRAVRDTKETLGNYKVLDALSELAVTDEELRSSEDDLASDGCQQPSDGPGGGGPQHERREGVDAPGTARGGDARPRKKLSDFELLRVVGQGSFGKVFQVLEKSTQQVYAMKVMQKAHVLARNQSGYMKAERDILKAVRHPYIVTLRYSFQSPSKLYLILDFINGGHLFFQLYQQGTFSEELARFYTAEIVLAVQHLHALDIIHRDLKPENILLDHEGHLKVTDFGVAKPAMSDDACTNSMAGTMEYMAPEILLDKGHGKQADWWSVGVLLFEMLTGAPPFTHKNRQKLQEKVGADTGIAWVAGNRRRWVQALEVFVGAHRQMAGVMPLRVSVMASRGCAGPRKRWVEGGQMSQLFFRWVESIGTLELALNSPEP
eukprot:jgi/Mesvir1/6447/Mv19526-RA.2